MRIAYFDCFSGISGDMTLGALLHAGVDEAAWRTELERLGVTGYTVITEKVLKEGIAAVRVEVCLNQSDTGHGRHLKDIAEILERSGLSETVRQHAMGAFTRLACAEARIHDMTPDTIHFHEVGAVDAIVDIVGACIALEMLGVQKVYTSPLPFNRGWVDCAHGTMPVPAPATLELLAGFLLRPDARTHELVTPTGAALLAEFAERGADNTIAPPPPMVLRAVGYGAGTHDTWIPNLLRVCIGDVVEPPEKSPAGTRSARSRNRKAESAAH